MVDRPVEDFGECRDAGVVIDGGVDAVPEVTELNTSDSGYTSVSSPTTTRRPEPVLANVLNP